MGQASSHRHRCLGHATLKKCPCPIRARLCIQMCFRGAVNGKWGRRGAHRVISGASGHNRNEPRAIPKVKPWSTRTKCDMDEWTGTDHLERNQEWGTACCGHGGHADQSGERGGKHGRSGRCDHCGHAWYRHRGRRHVVGDGLTGATVPHPVSVRSTAIMHAQRNNPGLIFAPFILRRRAARPVYPVKLPSPAAHLHGGAVACIPPSARGAPCTYRVH